jgi:hypothetical protein
MWGMKNKTLIGVLVSAVIITVAVVGGVALYKGNMRADDVISVRVPVVGTPQGFVRITQNEWDGSLANYLFVTEADQKVLIADPGFKENPQLVAIDKGVSGYLLWVIRNDWFNGVSVDELEAHLSSTVDGKVTSFVKEEFTDGSLVYLVTIEIKPGVNDIRAAWFQDGTLFELMPLDRNNLPTKGELVSIAEQIR